MGRHEIDWGRDPLSVFFAKDLICDDLEDSPFFVVKPVIRGVMQTARVAVDHTAAIADELELRLEIVEGRLFHFDTARQRQRVLIEGNTIERA